MKKLSAGGKRNAKALTNSANLAYIEEIITLLSFSILSDKHLAALVAMKVMSEIRARKNINYDFLPVLAAILVRRHSVKMYKSLYGTEPTTKNWSYIHPSTTEINGNLGETEYLIKSLSVEELDMLLLCGTKTISLFESAVIFEITIQKSIKLYLSAVKTLKRLCRKNSLTKTEVIEKSTLLANKVRDVFSLV